MTEPESVSAEPVIRYDTIGRGYGNVRREDPVLRARIHAALRDARSVVNVGAGTGSYEPSDRYVLAIEPSDVMASQRPPHAPPALRAFAGALPLRDGAVDAAMAVMTVHHWDAEQERGVRELRRVARGPVVIVTIDPRVCCRLWLLADYLPEAAALVERIYPLPEQLCAWLGGSARIEPVLVARDTPDWSILSYWAHPERFLDPDARASTSSIARLPLPVVERAVNALRADLATGGWERKHGALRSLAAYDAGWRVIVAG
jgi:SAM-dependent methyltransferase